MTRDSLPELGKEQQIADYQSLAYQEADRQFILAAIDEDPTMLKRLADALRHQLSVKAEKDAQVVIHENVRRLDQCNKDQMALIFTEWHGEKWSSGIFRSNNVNEMRNILLLGTGDNQRTKLPVKSGLPNSALVLPCLQAYEKILVFI